MSLMRSAPQSANSTESNFTRLILKKRVDFRKAWSLQKSTDYTGKIIVAVSLVGENERIKPFLPKPKNLLH